MQPSAKPYAPHLTAEYLRRVRPVLYTRCHHLHDIVALILHPAIHRFSLPLLHYPTLFYLFLDHRLPARKKAVLYERCLSVSLSVASAYTHEASHGRVRCETRAALPCICIIARQHLPGRSAAILYPSTRSPDCGNPNPSNAFFTPSPSGAVRSRKSTSTQGHCYAIARTHESRQQLRILHRRILGSRFPSPLLGIRARRVTVASIHLCELYCLLLR